MSMNVKFVFENGNDYVFSSEKVNENISGNNPLDFNLHNAWSRFELDDFMESLADLLFSSIEVDDKNYENLAEMDDVEFMSRVSFIEN